MTVETLIPETKVERAPYEVPSVRIMTEEEILRSFQVTQAMATWWTGLTSPCTC